MVCYNSAMSEERSGPYSRLSHPHTGDPRVDPEARTSRPKTRRTTSAVEQRRKLEKDAMVSRFFDSEQLVEQEPVVPETSPAVNPEPELRERALSFERETPMFKTSYDPITGEIIIPRTMDEAEELFLGRLPISLDLEIDKSCLEKGKRGGTAIKRVGKSWFGAFTIALYPTVDEDGRDIDIPILIDMRKRSLRRDNEVQRFRRETSSLFYYASLPRVSSKGTS